MVSLISLKKYKNTLNDLYTTRHSNYLTLNTQDYILKKPYLKSGRFTFFVFLISYSLIFFNFLTNVKSDMNFVSIANWGFDDNPHRLRFFNTFKKYANDNKYTLIVSPGSNFAQGVNDLNDTNWKYHFDDLFTDKSGALKIPFYTVLGTHDWAGNYTAQILRTEHDNELEINKNLINRPIWHLPNWWHYYARHISASSGPSFIKSAHTDLGIGLIFIDTWILSDVFPDKNVHKAALNDLEQLLISFSPIMDYIIVIGDEAMYTQNGNNSLRRKIMPLFKRYAVDAYISGSDFSLEVVEHDDVTFINCGSSYLGDNSMPHFSINRSKFFSAMKGFCTHKLATDGFYTEFIDGLTGDVLYRYKRKINPVRQSKKVNSTDTKAFSLMKLPEVKYHDVPYMMIQPANQDQFVEVIGTIGICIFSFFVLLNLLSFGSKMSKNHSS